MPSYRQMKICCLWLAGISFIIGMFYRAEFFDACFIGYTLEAVVMRVGQYYQEKHKRFYGN